MTLAALVTPYTIALYLIAINFAAFAAFGIDKMLARNGQWRIAESTLLSFASFGGSPGAYAGRRAFRHKTRKQPFSNNLHLIAAMQLVAIALFLGWMFRG